MCISWILYSVHQLRKNSDYEKKQLNEKKIKSVLQENPISKDCLTLFTTVKLLFFVK